MTIDDAVAFFGSQAALAEKLGITPEAVSMWKARGGVIPENVQFRIQVISRGRLKADHPANKSA